MSFLTRRGTGRIAFQCDIGLLVLCASLEWFITSHLLVSILYSNRIIVHLSVIFYYSGVPVRLWRQCKLSPISTADKHCLFYASAHLFCSSLCADDITMVICPGIGNHSEKHYIRTFVDHSQKQGYRCAVLNHLGALPNIELTSPRMFTYGTWSWSPPPAGYFNNMVYW